MTIKLRVGALLCLILVTTSAFTLGGPESVSTSRYQIQTGTRGMVVSDDREASEWGATILRKGGNAIDAAVATAFALAVTRPHYASLGGGGFLLYCPHPQNGVAVPCQAIDYRSKAPAESTRDMYIRNGKANTTLSQDGALAAAVPGAPAGLLLALEKFGTFSRQTILKQPIYLAKNGYSFSPHSEIASIKRWSAMNDEAKKIFGCRDSKKSLAQDSDKHPCPPGTIIRQPDLAKALELISRSGSAGFYTGTLAKNIASGIQKAGGIISLEDLKTYQPQLKPPLHGLYQGLEIVAMPPPSSGGALILQLLGYAERADRDGAFKYGFGSANAVHAITYAMALAFADRAHYFGDPDFARIPLELLISPAYLDQQWKTFKMNKVSMPESHGDLSELAKAQKEPQNTTHFSVIDREGNAVAITTTVNDNFGSGFVPPGTGIVMNNDMDDFSVQPGVPNLFGLVGGESNSIAPLKKPLSSMSPTIVRDSNGNSLIAIGAAGGPRIITSVFQSLLNRLRFNMSLKDAVSAPRFHQQWRPLKTDMEQFGFSYETRTLLTEKGHTLNEVPTLGKVHAVERLPNGRTSGAPDPRGEGVAVAE